jgi:hypothetical protein
MAGGNGAATKGILRYGNRGKAFNDRATAKEIKNMKKFKLILFGFGLMMALVVTMALAINPVSTVKAADTELFVHKAPDFTLNAPKDWIKSDKSLNPNCVLRKTSSPMEGLPVLDVLVSNLPEGKTYKEMTKDIIKFLQEKYQASNCQVLYERDIKLKDGTPAYELELKWDLPVMEILLFTYELVVFKDKKIIGVAMTNVEQVSDDLKQFPLSLTLK